MGRGKVALITGGARGQGRAHALRLAEEGADIVILDACAPIPTVGYDLPIFADLQEVAKSIEALDRRVIARQVDVRDQAGLDETVAEALAEFGRIDIVCANAGVASSGLSWELEDDAWQTVLDILLTGTCRTTKAVVPAMIEAGNGGSIIMTSSVLGTKGLPQMGHYVAAKHGVMGLMRTMANELGQYRIRVNCVQPGSVHTKMVDNEGMIRLFRPDLENPTFDDAREAFATLASLPDPLLDAEDISNAVLWLASDESRHVTGIGLPVDAGWINK